MGNKKNNLFGLIAMIVFLIFMFADSIVSFVTSMQWFTSIGYLNTFLVALKAKLLIGIPLFIGLFTLLVVYFRVLFRKYVTLSQTGVTKESVKRVKRWINYGSIAGGLFLAFVSTQGAWWHFLRVMNQSSFGLKDPIFNLDVSFYMFVVPFLQSCLSLGIFIIIYMVATTIGFYALIITVFPPAEGTVYYLNPSGGPFNVLNMFQKNILDNAFKRLATLGVAFFILLGLNFLITAFDIMYSKRGVAFGAGYTDVHVTLIGYQVLAVLSWISAGLFFIGVVKKSKRWVAAGPVAIIAVAIIMGGTSFVVQRLIVEPDENNKEREYLKHNIEFTQKAFGLDQVDSIDFDVKQNLTMNDIKANQDIINNIRINDETPLKQIYNQIQAIRLYYEFTHVTVDRYKINGEYTQVYLSPRELNINKLEPKAQTWINEHLKYTHGHGIVMSTVNDVESDGLPKLTFKNIPSSTETDLKLTRPEIYFGEQSKSYIIVNTDENEFDYPSGSDNKSTRYQGKDGIQLNGLNKLLYAFKEKSLKLLFSGNVNADSKIMINRSLYERVNQIAPFLVYDDIPQIIVNQENGKLYWMIDAYTVSENFPYSHRYSYKNIPLNYIRNSVKVVIDAYEGTTDFYVVDQTDPIIKTYQKIYEGLFKSADQMPLAIREHMRYPKNLFDIQANAYKQYHIDNPEVFYNGEDVWDIANQKYLSESIAYAPNYVMAKLPNSNQVELLLNVPFTPKKKANMTSLLLARSDGANYGKLFMYRFPKDKTVDGPMMIESKIDQDSVISPQFTLWGQEGSSVLRGNVLVVPIGESLLYVEPIYLKAENENSLPEMKRVVIAYKNKVVMESTLQEALDKVFENTQVKQTEVSNKSDNAGQKTPQNTTGQPGVSLEEAKKIYEELKKTLNQLDQIIKNLESK